MSYFLTVIMMTEVEITKMSSKGQIVIPRQLREEMDIREGETFAVAGNDDTIILKKVTVPSREELFQKVTKWGTEFAKKKGLKEEDVMKIIHKRRGIRSA